LQKASPLQRQRYAHEATTKIYLHVGTAA
jgi:hypothetical protein